MGPLIEDHAPEMAASKLHEFDRMSGGITEQIKTVVISGNIGVGKSTLLTHISRFARGGSTKFFFIPEPMDTLSERFQQFNRFRAAAAWQLSLLAHYLAYQKEIEAYAKSNPSQHVVAVFERSPFDARHVFVPLQKEMISGGEQVALEILFQQVEGDLFWRQAKFVHLVVSSSSESLERYHQRGREFETFNDPIRRSIEEKYDEFFRQWFAPAVRLEVGDVTLAQMEELGRAMADILGRKSSFGPPEYEFLPA